MDARDQISIAGQMAPTPLMLLILFLFSLLLCSNAAASTVAVHDPSIIIVYKDGSGNSYPENDAGKTRSKHYYVFGTQLGGAYSKDMIDWTAFTPSFLANGTVSTDYLQVFKAAATWSGHTTSDAVKGNLWAPDVIWNKVLKKWCMYYSINGDDWMSSIVLLTADKVEGPYAYAGTVVYSGMDPQSSGAGNADYQKVTGSGTVAARYLDASSKWTGTYGTSAIDPAVSYDEQGRLWMAYGSWSGGIFLLKLDENTGLRNYTWNYGFAKDTAMSGTSLRYDKYMGLHIAGGYYVSGEGSYIRYLKDPSGTGYYYLFVSMGFYSPDGGYTMRVYRSATIDGEYVDVTGDKAVFSKYVFNFGNNVQYGFPILQNYKWSWWPKGEVAQGHNSVLRDEDGNGYLVYHRKFDDGTAFHNVEVHQLVYNKQGWILAAPFEYRVGYGLPAKALGIDEIVGAYGTIIHKPVDYVNLATNQESPMLLKADGTVSGAYTGTWSYEYAAGRHYLTLTTSAGTFSGVVLEQLMNDHSSRTVSFTAMNPANELALWGYRKPTTKWGAVHDYANESVTVGAADYSLAWNDTTKFIPLSVSGDFEAEYVFKESTSGLQNWNNWSLILTGGAERWFLRGDAFSLSTFTGSTVTHKTDWNGTIDFKTAYANKQVRLLVRRTGSVIDVLAFADSVLVASSTATGCPTVNLGLMLGGDAISLKLLKTSASKVVERERVGTVTDYGTYGIGFDVAHSTARTVTGDFRLRYRFVNQHSSESQDNWTNFLVRSVTGGKISFLRADAYAMNPTGTFAFSYDWTWDKFLPFVSGATVDMTIRRAGSTIVYDAQIVAMTGSVVHYVATNTGAGTLPITFDLTTERGMIDLLEADTIAGTGGPVTVGVGASKIPEAPYRAFVHGGRLAIDAQASGSVQIRTVDGRLFKQVDYVAGRQEISGLLPGLVLVGRETFVIH